MNETHESAVLRERPCPLIFLVPCALLAGIVWLCALMGQLPLH
jgi:hypothetical protein